MEVPGSIPEWLHRDVSFQAMAWTQALIRYNSHTSIYFQPVWEAFSMDTQTFSGFFLQVGLHPWLQIRTPAFIFISDLCWNWFSFLLLSLQFLMGGWGTGYSYGCQEVDYSNSPQALRVSCGDKHDLQTLMVCCHGWGGGMLDVRLGCSRNQWHTLKEDKRTFT